MWLLYNATTMIRTQVYLPKNVYEQIKQRAAAKHTSAAAELRDLVNEGLRTNPQLKTGQTLDKLTHLGITGGPKDLAANVDKYLYDDWK